MTKSFRCWRRRDCKPNGRAFTPHGKTEPPKDGLEAAGERRTPSPRGPQKRMYLDRITLIGFLGGEAEKKVSNTTNIAVFSLATKTSWKNDAGTWESRRSGIDASPSGGWLSSSPLSPRVPTLPSRANCAATNTSARSLSARRRHRSRSEFGKSASTPSSSWTAPPQVPRMTTATRRCPARGIPQPIGKSLSIPPGTVGAAWGPALGKVWPFIRSQPGLWTDGHNISLFHHPDALRAWWFRPDGASSLPKRRAGEQANSAATRAGPLSSSGLQWQAHGCQPVDR